MRAGTYGMTLLSVPLNAHALTALADEPKTLVELRRAIGAPPQTTLRGHLQTLTRLGVLERRRQPEFPGSVDYQLGEAGVELLGVARVLQAWLGAAPQGRVELGSVAAKSAIRALSEGWSSTIVRAIAAKPLALTELNHLISTLNYPSLERRLAAMRLAGLIESSKSAGRSRPYVATEWLRGALAPLLASARWERLYSPQSASVARLDIESAFLLALPILPLPGDLTGSCKLVVELRADSRGALAGVLVRIEDGRVVACTTRLGGPADAWASGTLHAWFSAVLEDGGDLLELGGDSETARTLLGCLHAAFDYRARLA